MTHGRLIELFDELVQGIYEGDQGQLGESRASFESRRGRVFEDDELWESWAHSFLEWRVCETDESTSELVKAHHAAIDANDSERAQGLHAWRCSQRSLYQVKDSDRGEILLRDLCGGAEFPIFEARGIVGFEPGAIVEARVLACGDELMLGRGLCFHAEGLEGLIESQAKARFAAGESREDIADHFASMKIRSRQYRHVAAERVYSGEFRA